MADEQELINQNEIERLLQQGGSSSDEVQQQPAPGDNPPDTPLDQSEIEALLGGGGEKPAAAAQTPEAAPVRQAPSPATKQAVPAAAAEPTPAEDDDKLLGQEDIEKLLNEAGKTDPTPKSKPTTRKETSPSPLAGEGDVAQDDIACLLNQAEEALESIQSDSGGDPPPGVPRFHLEEFSGAPASVENATLDLIRDVDLDVKIELGRTQMYLEDLLKLRKGSVVPLDKLAGDPVDIFVNGRLIARGEVLVLNDNFCVRVAELVAGGDPK